MSADRGCRFEPDGCPKSKDPTGVSWWDGCRCYREGTPTRTMAVWARMRRLFRR